ncbi:MAG: tetratricopeptide repeat protein [Phycisphaerales bacterium]|nr:tetratricopeptide repeat protein [Phycisphaerales bacterium]
MKKMLIAASTAMLLAGCSGGHGKHTEAQLNVAKERMNQIKSATEWDMARQAFLSGDLKKALTKVDLSLALNESVPKSHVLRGRILIEQGFLENAMDSFLRAEALDQQNVEAQYYLGIIFERFSEREKALARYERAAELDPANAQYVIAAAEMLIDLDRIGEAERYLSSRSTLFQHNAGVRHALGHIATLEGRHVEAVRMYNEARLLAPDDMSILEDLIRAQVATRQYAAAEYNLNRILSVEDYQTRRDLQHARARCLMRLDRPVEAREILLALTADDAGATDVHAWVDLGNVAYVLKDLNRVRAASSRAIALAPARHEGYLLRALWERRRGNLEGALTYMNEAATRRGDDVQVLMLQGLVQHEMHDYRNAAVTFAKALRQQPKNSLLQRLVFDTGRRLEAEYGTD